MANIQVGDKVRILVNYSVKGHLWEPEVRGQLESDDDDDDGNK